MSSNNGQAERSPHAYLPTLDLLRILAFTMVALFHTPSLTRLGGLAQAYLRAGHFGVELFMVISGWLIGGLLIREYLQRGRIDVRRFYQRRWLRTLPPYYVMLVVLATAGAWLSAHGMTEWAFWQHILFLQEYTGENRYGVSWSLCVEEHFYLVAPWFLALLLRTRRAWSLVLPILGWLAFSAFCRHERWLTGETTRALTHLRADGLCVGLLMAYVAHAQPALWQRLGRSATLVGLIGLASTLVVFYRTTDATYYGYVWLPLLVAVVWGLVVFAAVHPASRLSRLTLPGARFLGELTFPMYLTHTVLPKEWTALPLPGGIVGSFVWRALLVVGSGVLLQKTVIEPSMRLRERWWPAPTKGTKVAPADSMSLGATQQA